MAFGDAREEELRFLLEVERAKGNYVLRPETQDMARREMIAWLLSEGLFFGPGDQVGTANPMKSSSEAVMEAMAKLAQGHAVDWVRLSHKGRVRVSELQQELRSGRLRDPMGILFDGRHADRGLRIGVIEATKERPVTVAFLDLNGMKEANDDLGHDAGDVLVRAYLSAVDVAVEDKGEAFRIGGDEVLVVLPGHSVDQASSVVWRAWKLLVTERLTHEGREFPHRSLCAGVVSVADPSTNAKDARRRADEEMYRAKRASKDVAEGTARPSMLAVEGRDLVDLAGVDLSEPR